MIILIFLTCKMFSIEDIVGLNVVFMILDLKRIFKINKQWLCVVK